MTNAATSAPDKVGKLRHQYHRLHGFDHDKFGLRARKYDAHFYAIVVALGIPLMSWVITDFYTKLVIACIWFALAPLLYFWLEGMEINSQIKRFGLLDQEESDRQRRTMYYLYFGVVFALVVWLIGVAVHIAANWSPSEGLALVLRSPLDTPNHYGPIEWAILIHTFVVAYLSIDVYYPLISNFLQATAGQRRFETETVTLVPPQNT